MGGQAGGGGGIQGPGSGVTMLMFPTGSVYEGPGGDEGPWVSETEVDQTQILGWVRRGFNTHVSVLLVFVGSGYRG